MELNQRMSAGDKAEQAIASLEEARQQGSVTSVEENIDEKRREDNKM